MRRPGIVTRSFTATAPRPAQAAALPPSNAPTVAFRQRHDVVAPRIDAAAFRPGWLVQSRLLSLHQAGRIDRDALDAALAWRAWCEITSPTRTQSWQVRVDISPGPRDADAARRVAAAAKLRACAEALGELRVRLLECCVVRDLSWREVAGLLRVSDKTAQSWVVDAVTALAAWRAGRTVAPPPAARYRIEPGRQ